MTGSPRPWDAGRARGPAYAGLRPTGVSITSLVIIGVNVAVWLAILATGGRASDLLLQLELRPREVCYGIRAGQCYPGITGGAWWQLLTSAFTHITVTHIGFNMLWVYLLGPALEASLGRARFIAVYLLSALAGSTLIYWASFVAGSTIGASGAVFGLMGASLVVALRSRGDVRGILTLIAISIAFTYLGGPDISWQGHVGGVLGGTAVAAILVYAPRTRVQVLGLAAFTLALGALLLLRTSQLT